MKYLVLLIAISIPFFAQAAWIDSSGKVRPDTESRQSAGNLGVLLVLTPDDKEFRQKWVSIKKHA